MKKKYLWIIAALLAFMGAGACVFFMWQEKRQEEETQAMYEQMRQKTWTQRPVLEPAPQEEKQELVIPVNFELLWEVNPDIYAWITVPGTAIDYPVVQDPADNSYYLNHTVEKTTSAAGSIFTELYNKKDFSDPHTVIYGHNMRDGSMFENLHQYEDAGFWEDHREIRIYTPDAIRHYRIFAAYVYDNRHLMQSFDCTDKEIYQSYLDQIYGQRNMNAVIDQETRATTEDRILTLSTCPNSLGSQYRYLIQAVLVEEEK